MKICLKIFKGDDTDPQICEDVLNQDATADFQISGLLSTLVPMFIASNDNGKPLSIIFSLEPSATVEATA